MAWWCSVTHVAGSFGGKHGRLEVALVQHGAFVTFLKQVVANVATCIQVMEEAGIRVKNIQYYNQQLILLRLQEAQRDQAK